MAAYGGNLAYPNPAGKTLQLMDSFCWRFVANDPAQRRYHFFWCDCKGEWDYRHAGNDVHGNREDRLVACRTGIVRHVDWGAALGDHQFMIVDSGGVGFYYAHTLSRLADYTPVTAGKTFVGLLGDEGGVPPHLHFGIFAHWRDTRSALDPHPALLKAKT